MNILKYVTDYLETATEVSVRGLGSIRKNRIAGRYHHETGNFLPPSNSILFDKQEVQPEKLEIYISEIENVPIEDVRAQVEAFSLQAQKDLLEGEQISLGALGFLLSQDGEISFHQDTTNSEDEFFGFHAISTQSDEISDIPAVETQEELSTEDVTTGIETVVPSNFDADQTSPTENESIVEPSEPIAQEPEEVTETEEKIEPAEKIEPTEEIETVIPSSSEVQVPTSVDEKAASPLAEQAEVDANYTEQTWEEEEKPKNNSFKWIVVIFLLIVALGLTYMAKPEWFDKIKGLKSDTRDVSKAAPLDSINADSLNKAIVQIDSVGNDSLLKDTVTYEVIVSAEKKQSRIDQMVTNYGKLGYKVKVLPGKTIKKISIGSYSTSKEALDSLNVIKKRLNNPEAYIFTLQHP